MHACHDGLNSWNSLSGHALGGGEAKVVNPLFVQASSENGPEPPKKPHWGVVMNNMPLSPLQQKNVDPLTD